MAILTLRHLLEVSLYTIEPCVRPQPINVFPLFLFLSPAEERMPCSGASSGENFTVSSQRIESLAVSCIGLSLFLMQNSMICLLC